jgi:hypothetical protein
LNSLAHPSRDLEYLVSSQRELPVKANIRWSFSRGSPAAFLLLLAVRVWLHAALPLLFSFLQYQYKPGDYRSLDFSLVI